MELTIDWSEANRELSQLMNQLRDMQRKSATQVLKDQARLFVRDCARMTPPFGDSPINESWSAQRKLGEAATAADVQAVFQPIDPEGMAKFISGTPKRKAAFIKRISNYARRGDIEAIRKIVIDIGYPCQGVLKEVSPRAHERERGKRGRVMTKKLRPWLILSKNSLKRYIKEKIGHVGKAKAGWAKAAAQVGLNLPNWITRHAGTSRGLCEDQTEHPTMPSITIGNLVAWAQEFEGLFGVVRPALRQRERAMKKQLEILMQKTARELR